MKFLILFFLIFFSEIFSQEIFVTGKVADSNTKNALSSANIVLYHLPDSTSIGTASDKTGHFKINKIKPGKYLLVSKYLGYETSELKLEIKNNSVDAGTILLKPSELLLEDILVVEKIPIAVQSGDTTVYNTDAFKINKDAVAEDLLKKIPGIQVEQGTVKAQGEEVKKVYVDGKSFFGDDPNIALKNVPADIIQKVQVFDQQNDQSQFTGFDDGSTSKAINIITKLNLSHATFGKFLTGYGNEDKYNINANYNRFSETERFSLLGQLNNTNEQNFGAMDLMGVMGGGELGMKSGGEPGSPGSGMPGNIQNNFVNTQSGLTNIKGFGVNYNNSWEDGELGTSYFFNSTNNDLTAQLNRSYLLSSNAGQNYLEDKIALNNNTNHRVNLRFDYQIDSLNQIRFIPSFSLQKNNSSSTLSAFTNENGSIVNSTNSKNTSDLTGINLNSLIMYRHKFNQDGRSITLGFNTSYKNSSGTKKQYSESSYSNIYSDTEIVNQNTEINNYGSTISSDIVYTEPINSYNFLMFNTSYSASNENNEKETYQLNLLNGIYDLPDTNLSNNYKKNYNTTSFGLGYRFKKNKFSLNANINYNIASLSSKQVYPAVFNIDKKFYSVLPSLIIRYNISSDKNFNLFYRAINSSPSVTQLQNVLDNSNPLQLTIGNPDLKQEYGHSLTLRLSTINFKNMHSLFLMLNGTYKNNYIGSRTIIAKTDTMLANHILLNSGSQITIPDNMDGYISAQSFFSYGLPVDLIYSNLNFNGSFNFTRTPGLINVFKNYANSFKYGLGLTISSNISSEVDFTISSTAYYNVVSNTFNKQNNEKYLSTLTSLRTYFLFFDQLVLQSELTHNYDGGLSSAIEPNNYQLNLSISKKFFDNNSAELKFSIYDVLNQQRNIVKQTTDYYTQEYTSNALGRYFLFSFIYNLRIFS